jgi:hypothetical protein
MSRRNMGIIGGVLIAVAALLTGTGFNFASASLKDTTSLVLFLVGLGVAIFLMMGNRVWASYCAIAATTITVIYVIDMFRGNGLDFSVKLVLLVIGVILALIATLGRKK